MRFAADENFRGPVLRGILLRLPNLDVVRVQDTEMQGKPDPEMLAWAAEQNRIVLTHDVRTLVNDAYARVEKGLPMPGVVKVDDQAPVGLLVDQLEILIEAGRPEDFDLQVFFIPMP